MLRGRASEGSAEHENPEEAHGVGSLHSGLFRVRRRGDLCRRGRGNLRGIALRLVWCCVRRNSALSPVRLGRLTELRRMHLPRTPVNRPFGGAGNSNPVIRSMPLMLDGLLEGLARLESRNLPGPYLHPLSGLRVLTFPRLLLPDVELPEARQLDLLTRLERLCYARRESFQVFSGFALWRVGVFDHPLYELLFVHGCFTPCLVMLTSLSPTLGRSARKHAIHRGSFVESWPSSPRTA